MISDLDDHGQPNPYFNATRRLARNLSEMIGIAKGVIADGEVCRDEARFLRDWVRAHPDVAEAWPGNVIAERMRKIFADGSASTDEREDLAELLEELTGGDVGIHGMLEGSTTLPLDDPPPSMEVTDRVFVFTGRFAYGCRRQCEEAVSRLGGTAEDNVTLRTNYLVIGTFGSRDWKETPFGTKIVTARAYREQNGWPKIVSEVHWAAHV